MLIKFTSKNKSLTLNGSKMFSTINNAKDQYLSMSQENTRKKFFLCMLYIDTLQRNVSTNGNLPSTSGGGKKLDLDRF